MKQQIADLEKAMKALDKAGLRLSVTTVKAGNALADAGNQFALAGKKAKASAQAIDQFIQALDKALPKRPVASQPPIVVVNTAAPPAAAPSRPVNAPSTAPSPAPAGAAPKQAPASSGNSRKSEEDKGWNAGRQAAIAKYIEAASDMATPMESIVTSAFTNLEKSLFDFVKTGKFNWNTLLVGVADEALRMLIKAGIGAVLEAISGPKKKEDDAAAKATKAVQDKAEQIPAAAAQDCVPCCCTGGSPLAPMPDPGTNLYGLRVPGLTRFANPNEDINAPMFGTRLPGYGSYPAMPGTPTPGFGTYSNMFGSRLPGFGADPFSLDGHVPGLGGMSGPGPAYGGSGSFFGPQPGASLGGAGSSESSGTSFFTEELRKFAATAIDVSALTQQVFETAFENIEQTLFNFVKTGELDLRGLFVGISDEVLKMLIKIGVRMAVNAMLGETIGATTTTTSAAQAATIAAAWSGPATLVSLATQGANAVPASLGIANTFALTNLMGVAHKGIDRVPYEGTWLLDKGERVLSARQNSDLTDYLQDAGSDPGQAGAQGFQINVAVNMSQSDGQTQVDGDDMQGRQLGTLIAAQVQQTLSREMRQGGLLWNQRNGYSR